MTKRRDGDHRQPAQKARMPRPWRFSSTDFRLIPGLPSPSPFSLSLAVALTLSLLFFLHPSAVHNVEEEHALRDPHEKVTFCHDAQAAASFYGPDS